MRPIAADEDFAVQSVELLKQLFFQLIDILVIYRFFRNLICLNRTFYLIRKKIERKFSSYLKKFSDKVLKLRKKISCKNMFTPLIVYDNV